MTLNQGFVAGLSGLLAYAAGLAWEIIFIWLLLALIDMLTGVIKARKNEAFKSAEMRNGLYKKASEAFLIVGLILTQRVAMYMGIDVPIATVFIGAFCFKEFASIMENAISMDIKIPQIVRKWFNNANNAVNGDDDAREEKTNADNR